MFGFKKNSDKERQKKIDNILKELEFKHVPINELTKLNGAHAFSWNGFFLKEKSVYLENSGMEINADNSLPQELEKKTNFLLKSGVVCVFVFHSDFASDKALREAIYERVLKAEASKNAIKVNDLAKTLYTNTFTGKELLKANKGVEKKEVETLVKKEEVVSKTEVVENVVKNKENKTVEEKQVPKGKETIEYVLKSMNYKYSKYFSNPLGKDQNFWNPDFLIIEPNVYISYCAEANKFNKSEEKISSEEKENFLSKNLKFIFLTKEDLEDESTLSKKIQKEIKVLQKIKDDTPEIVLPKEEPTKKSDVVKQEKFLDDNFKDELTIGSHFKGANDNYAVSEKTYSDNNDLSAIIGGLLIIFTILLFLIFIIVLVYISFFR